ncbi:MAG: outer membrane beta-barrel protein [Prevotellaceae bacterium]|nr:outer membrane beta-barrel protein [Prevotellaceae bacterium]
MMKKMLAMLLMVAMAGTATAQFEAGKKYVNASLAGAGLSYSDYEDVAFGVSAQAGYMFQQDFMLLGEAGFDYRHKDFQSLYIGGKGRYYIEQNGLFLGAGVRFLHEFKNHNDFQFTPEVGYCYFVSKNLTIEPVAYVDVSLADFSKNTKVGLKIGLGYYF